MNSLEPDIICLQETTTGTSKYYEKSIDIKEYLPNYELLAMCNVAPSWFNTIYGNMMLVRKTFLDKIKQSNTSASGLLCDLSLGKCLLNQYTKTYEYPIPSQRILFGEHVADFTKKETRCFIKISLGTFDLYCTHLEAYDKNIRRKQLDELAKTITRKSIIVGDFNIVDVDLYKNNSDPPAQDEWNYVKNFPANGLADGDYDYDYITNTLKWIDAYKYTRTKSKI